MILYGFLALLAFSTLAIAGYLSVAFVQRNALPWISALLKGYVRSQLVAFEERLSDLEQAVVALPKTLEEERVLSKKLRQRATYHVRRVREELARLDLEDGEIEGIAGELGIVDAVGSRAGGVQPVHSEVAEVPEAAEETVDPMQAAFAFKWGHHG